MDTETKILITLTAILVILFSSYQGSQDNEIVVIDRNPQYIPDVLFVDGHPTRRTYRRRRRRRHGHSGHHPEHFQEIVPGGGTGSDLSESTAFLGPPGSVLA